VRRRALVPILVLLAALAGCGGGGGGNGKLTVSAAASLKKALPQYQPSARYSFAGSDVLAAQIKAGARPDVYAAANTRFPQQLFAAGLVEKPVVFAGNRLVVAVPASSTKVKTLADLEKPGVTIAAGSPSVPVGSYTHQVLARLPAARAKRILANIRSNEPDVAGVVGKLTQGAADAGFVYVTDVQAAGGRLAAIELPASLRPRVAYAVAVVKGTKRRAEATRFVRGLLNGAGERALAAAGFDPPPAAP
jgi:molybdate transport system substrate-binding protein